MEELIKTPKISVELKQTAKGAWYLGSLKVNTDYLEELESLIEAISVKIEGKIKKLNGEIETKEEDIEEKTEEIILSPEEERLFLHLKKVRLELANKENYPPYIVFHDSMLKKMAKLKPVSHESMLELIGEKKFEKYGKIFIKEIFQFS